MEFIPTAIPDVVLIRPRVFGDPRGYFFESWEERKFAAGGVSERFVQDNHSHSTLGVLRGLHYQIEHPQGKLVRVAAGRVFDVAVDLRRKSPSFGRWVGHELSDQNHLSMWIPPGFAHGYLTQSDFADVLYRCTDFYAPASERAILWSDPDLAVAWPLPPGDTPVVSQRDSGASRFREAECFP
jgi:dTDP-4-dehydrorhamnose 3,5-epimerase